MTKIFIDNEWVEYDLQSLHDTKGYTTTESKDLIAYTSTMSLVEAWSNSGYTWVEQDVLWYPDNETPYYIQTSTIKSLYRIDVRTTSNIYKYMDGDFVIFDNQFTTIQYLHDTLGITVTPSEAYGIDQGVVWSWYNQNEELPYWDDRVDKKLWTLYPPSLTDDFLFGGLFNTIDNVLLDDVDGGGGELLKSGFVNKDLFDDLGWEEGGLFVEPQNEFVTYSFLVTPFREHRSVYFTKQFLVTPFIKPQSEFSTYSFLVTPFAVDTHDSIQGICGVMTETSDESIESEPQESMSNGVIDFHTELTEDNTIVRDFLEVDLGLRWDSGTGWRTVTLNDWWYAGFLNEEDSYRVSQLGFSIKPNDRAGEIGALEFNPEYSYKVIALYSDIENGKAKNKLSFDEGDFYCENSNKYPNYSFWNQLLLDIKESSSLQAKAWRVRVQRTVDLSQKRVAYLNLSRTPVSVTAGSRYVLYDENGNFITPEEANRYDLYVFFKTASSIDGYHYSQFEGLYIDFSGSDLYLVNELYPIEIQRIWYFVNDIIPNINGMRLPFNRMFNNTIHFSDNEVLEDNIIPMSGVIEEYVPPEMPTVSLSGDFGENNLLQFNEDGTDYTLPLYRTKILYFYNTNDEVPYDSSKTYAVIDCTNSVGDLVLRAGVHIMGVNEYAFAHNNSGGEIVVAFTRVAVCSSNQAIIETVYNYLDIAYNSLKYRYNGVFYYWVLDDVQEDWTDDLSSIGYSLTKNLPTITMCRSSVQYFGYQIDVGETQFLMDNGNNIAYDSSVVYGFRRWADLTTTMYGSGQLINDGGYLAVKNTGDSLVTNLYYADYATCSDASATLVTVYDINNVAYDAFKYTSDGTDYYYVLDDVQIYWTDDLSSIGYHFPVVLPTVSKDSAYPTNSSYTKTLSPGDSSILYNHNPAGVPYDTNNSYSVYGYYAQGGDWVYGYFFDTQEDSGCVSAENITNSTITNIVLFRYAACSSSDATVVTVYDSSNNTFNAFKYTLNGVYYYYVLDGTQTDWTDNLSSIGYTE